MMDAVTLHTWSEVQLYELTRYARYRQFLLNGEVSSSILALHRRIPDGRRAMIGYAIQGRKKIRISCR